MISTAVHSHPWYSVTGSEDACSGTNPEFRLTDDYGTDRVKPYSTDFWASWTAGGPYWQDSYWSAGYHDSNSHVCGPSFPFPLKVNAKTDITASMSFSTSSNFLGGVGFDIWFTENPKETSYTAMVADPRSTELVVAAGTGGYWYSPCVNPGWHRQIITAQNSVKDGYGVASVGAQSFNLTGINVAAIIRGSHCVPAGSYLMAIDMGSEFYRGTLHFDSASLSMLPYGPQHKMQVKHPTPRPIIHKKPVPKPKPKKPIAKLPNVLHDALVTAQRILAKAHYKTSVSGPKFHGGIRVIMYEKLLKNGIVRLGYKIRK